MSMDLSNAKYLNLCAIANEEASSFDHSLQIEDLCDDTEDPLKDDDVVTKMVAEVDGEDEEEDSSFCVSEDDGTDDDSEEDDFTIANDVVAEIQDDQRLTSAIEDYGDDDHLFTESDLQKWKEKEKALAERYRNGYYRCKIKHASVYNKLTKLYEPYITIDALKMLHHPFSTQKNEAMNKSVSAFAPKGKTFSRTESLDTRVGVAAGIQVLGYELFWDKVFHAFDLVMDDKLRLFLRQLQKKKDRKRQKASTTAGKYRRTKRKHDKLREDVKQDMLSQAEGTHYETGIAFKRIKKRALTQNASNVRNPKGTAKKDLRCKYWHPDYCQRYGHKTSQSNECFMSTKTKAERDAAVIKIMEDHIEAELQKPNSQGTCYINLDYDL